ncbi:Transposon TX1 uncharacterized 149 kDa protein [Vitis vinifera]|uniref:Transposon TX1 uncharacterized 149 kDa protein n=1 Tax=Vitis vinifera TaxID=29760 RepID=A0A438E365_VITVI|nr:Transposon TX1 uncharacterized 149 kDa protein [Vitis vinifera]
MSETFFLLECAMFLFFALGPFICKAKITEDGSVKKKCDDVQKLQQCKICWFRLESPFTEEEIFKAIFQMDRDKAPGPDGFTIAVFQDCWEVIKEDLVKVFAEFHRSGIINQSTNVSFIVLLPKKSMLRRISDFRPISLITSLYKIIAKVLAGRIRGVLHETIHSTQGAFVQGRQILDAVLIANEIVDEKRRSGEEGVVFKIDFEKAYDHVSWDFLDHVLEMKGFGLRWRKWMRGCLSSVSFAVLVNVADVLSRMLLKAEERNVLEGFRVGRNRTRVSHLQFADDTIFFSSSREEDMMTLKNVLLVLAEMLDCKASGWPILYLGLPLGGNPKTSGFWDPWKWLWRYPREGSALWHQVILSIYGSHSNGWDVNNIVRWSHRCPWKAIALVYQEFSKFTRSFHSQSFFLALSQFSESPPVFPTKFVWIAQVPFKVKSFVWLVAHKKVNTNDLLQLRRPYKALSPDICKLCMKHGETVDHLFLHCSLI